MCENEFTSTLTRKYQNMFSELKMYADTLSSIPIDKDLPVSEILDPLDAFMSIIQNPNFLLMVKNIKYRCNNKIQRQNKKMDDVIKIVEEQIKSIENVYEELKSTPENRTLLYMLGDFLSGLQTQADHMKDRMSRIRTLNDDLTKSDSVDIRVNNQRGNSMSVVFTKEELEMLNEIRENISTIERLEDEGSEESVIQIKDCIDALIEFLDDEETLRDMLDTLETVRDRCKDRIYERNPLLKQAEMKAKEAHTFLSNCVELLDKAKEDVHCGYTEQSPEFYKKIERNIHFAIDCLDRQ